MASSSCICTGGTFPTILPQPSLTSYIKIYVTNTICCAGTGARNQYDMFGFDDESLLRKFVCRMNLKPDEYNPYIVTKVDEECRTYKFALINYNDNLTRNSIYFLVSKSITTEIPPSNLIANRIIDNLPDLIKPF